MIAEIIENLEITKALLAASEAQASLDEWGIFCPDYRPLLVARKKMIDMYPRMAEILHFLGSSSLMALPAEADLTGPLADDIHRYMDTDTRHRRGAHPPVPAGTQTANCGNRPTRRWYCRTQDGVAGRNPRDDSSGACLRRYLPRYLDRTEERSSGRPNDPRDLVELVLQAVGFLEVLGAPKRVQCFPDPASGSTPFFSQFTHCVNDPVAPASGTRDGLLQAKGGTTSPSSPRFACSAN